MNITDSDINSKLINGIIIKGIGGLYYVQTQSGIYTCQARGLFRKQDKSPLVGDYAGILITDEEKKEGVIRELNERKNELARPKAANIDLTVVVFSAANPAFSYKLLDNFLIMIEKQGLQSVICINKTDLVSKEATQPIVNVYEKAGYNVVRTSTIETCGGIETLMSLMENKVAIFAGPSGTGKTSIINKLLLASGLPSEVLKTGELSKKIQRGKHTTRHAELLAAGYNSFVVDTPGFASLNLNTIKKNELQIYYPEFKSLSGNCFYTNCLHVTEHDCAIKEQVGKTIDEGRYNRYVQFLDELEAFNVYE